MDTATILIIDDEADIRNMVVTALEMKGFTCLTAENAQQGHALVVDSKPDLILLDWMMPGTTGIELARRLKREENTAEIPIILLTAKSEEDNKIVGLDSGADDYVTKPFSPRELIARIRAVLRRAPGRASTQLLQAGSLTLDTVSKRVTIGKQAVSLGPTEFRLLAFFMLHPDRAYTRSQLLDQVWGGNVYVEDRTVDVHIRRLRLAVELDGCDAFIQTVRGTGYRFSIT